MNPEQPSNKTQWLIFAGFYLISLGLAGYIGSIRPIRNVVQTQQEAQLAACQKLSQGKIKAIDVAALGVFPGIQPIANQVQTVEVQLVEQKTKLTDTHPAIANLKARQAALNTLLQQRFKGACKILNPQAAT